MQPYLTPERFRTMRTGAKVTGLTDLELREVITDASAIVDAYCNVPLLPKPHSFRGGEALLEQHTWLYPASHFDPGQRRIYPFHRPIKEISAFTLMVAPGATAAIPLDSLVVNQSEGWVEVTSLAIASNSGLFGVVGWVLPIGGMANPLALISYTYGQSIAETGDRAYPITDTETKVFQTSHGFWTSDAVTVYVDGTEMIVDTDYSVDRSIGRVTFVADQTGVVTVDYSHELERDIVGATAQITEFLLGSADLAAKGLAGGVQRVKVGEISLDRGSSPSEVKEWLRRSVPHAALLLDGHVYMWMA